MAHLMVQGTSSGVGKTIIVTALCRIFSEMGYSVAPFKSQNMSRHSYHIPNSGLRVSAAQALQAAAARCPITTSLNPVLLEPRDDNQSTVYVNGSECATMDASSYYATFVMSRGLVAASDALQSLISKYEIVILEGAGSPAEINLAQHDIANMRMAHLAGDAPVIIVSDIGRGGAFASLAGTMALLPQRDTKLIKGFVLNRFRGDPSVLEPAYEMIHDITGVPIVGTIPELDMSGIPEEDSLDDRRDAPRLDTENGMPPDIDRTIDRLAASVRAGLDMDEIAKMVAPSCGA